ncbi:GAF domain-containing protein [Pseudoalteromonas mariniglutinosa]|uniref:GAF domain-containing protein n=1 Tax=Pseudoalteromonas mariniglutinosa TaxID=206042 RepID=UPI00384CD163
MISSYLAVSQLDLSPSLVEQQLIQLEQYLADSTLPDVRWQYQIPELGEGGACSLFGHLQEQPFKLTDYLHDSQVTAEKLAKLQKIVDYVVLQSQVDWYGIYQVTATEQGPQLLKLAYHGAPSRPLFPLTETFAKASNNVQVALTKQGRVINDVAAYLEQGGEYYTCDPKVKAETCLPLLDDKQNCLGIIDAEAFNNQFFDQQTLALLVACCIKIPQFLV